jgi:hypothetical protein
MTTLKTELPPEHWRALVETIIDRIGLAQLMTIINQVIGAEPLTQVYQESDHGKTHHQ